MDGVDASGETIRQQDVLLGDPIVGQEEVTWDDSKGEGALAASPLKSPRTPTAAARERHNLTHLPYCDWCPFCVSCRRPNSHHRLSQGEERQVPLLVADYGFLRDRVSQDLVSMIVVKVYPYKIILACVVDMKGPEKVIVDRIAKFIQNLGLINFVYRSDREPALLSLLDEAVKESGREGGQRDPEAATTEEPDQSAGHPNESMLERLDREGRQKLEGSVDAERPTATATPEHSHPGESQSNGKAERAIQSVEDLARTLKTSLEARLGCRIPMAHPVMNWLVEHAALLLTKYQLDKEGRTA